MTSRAILATLLASLSSRALAAETVERVFLTFPDKDTSRAVTVNFDCPTSQGEARVRLHETGSAQQHRYAGPLEPLTIAGRSLAHIKLTGLKPATAYSFRVSLPSGQEAGPYRFRTPAADGRAIRFANGGDICSGPSPQRLIALIGRSNPDFVILGGDLAYDDGRAQNWHIFEAWLNDWSRLRSPDGRLVPLLLAIGNHEVDGAYGQPPEKARFFMPFLANGQQGQQTYFVRKFGKNLALWILDSGHIHAHGGEQARWLEQSLEENRGAAARLAAYHVPLYPSHRPFDETYSRAGREHWLPLFDRWRLTAALEHHDHLQKRTFPLRHNRKDPQGTVYFGDGCMGQAPRPPDLSRWYLASATACRHFWSFEVSQTKLKAQAIDENNKVVDSWETALNPKR